MDPTVWPGFAVQVSCRNKGNSKNPTALLPGIQDKDGKSLSNFKTVNLRKRAMGLT